MPKQETLSIMIDNDLDLAALRAFRSVVRQGSFSGAARALNAPKSTISKRISDLELSLGVRLIERTTRQFRITAEGDVLVAHADRLLSASEDIRRTLSDAGSTPRGHLHIAVPMLFGQMLMGHIAARFLALYPDITLDCAFSNRTPDLVEEGFDGAVTIGAMEDSSQIVRVLGRTQGVFVAAPSFPGLGKIKMPQDLEQVTMVGLSPGWPGPFVLEHSSGKQVQVRLQPRLKLGSQLAVRDAVASGAGIGALARFLVLPDLRSGRLVQVLPDWMAQPKTLNFVYPSPQSVTARLRAFIDLLIDELAKVEDWAQPTHKA